MVQSVELLFDGETEAALRRSWDVLHAAGLPSLATNHNDSNRPHVTVAVADQGLERAAEPLREILADAELAGPGLPATVGAMILFGGHRHRFVLARAIVLSRSLQELHASVHRATAVAAAEEVPENVRPDAWTPHATLARRVPSDRLGAALDLLDPAPIGARFVAARLWDSGPKTVTPLT